MKVKRHVAGPVSGFFLSTLAAAILLGAATFDLWLVPRVSPGDPLVFSIRVPLVGMYKDTYTGGATYRHTRIVQGRGTTMAAREARLLRAFEEARRPPTRPLMVGLGLAALLLFWLYTSYLRVLGGSARFLRTHIVLVALIVGLILSNKVILAFTAWSAIWVPLLAVVVPVALHLGRRVAAATSLASAVALCLLTPIDVPVLIVIICQGLAVAATVRPYGPIRLILAGTLASALAGVLAHTALALLLQHFMRINGAVSGPMDLGRWPQSDLAASFGGPLLGGIIALALSPVLQRMLRQVSRSRLAALTDFEHPLLRRLASRAPGTWAHSLSMANMAEMAANAIHANGLLVRVGAYYHDLGKTVQPEYFIENQGGGDNPHDKLDPEVSADAIVSHVSEGVKLARKHKLPAAVMEFIYTHHGSERLEFFWHKKMQAEKDKAEKRVGDAAQDDSDFRYRGQRPQTRETAILALCDSVEAAARSMESPDANAIAQLVRQIVFTKLVAGVLDESGLTIAELRTVTDSMIETLRSSMHMRVKYPWQKQDEKSDPHAANASRESVGEAASVSNQVAGGASDGEQRSSTATYGAARAGNGHVPVTGDGQDGKTGRTKAQTRKLGIVSGEGPDENH